MTSDEPLVHSIEQIIRTREHDVVDCISGWLPESLFSQKICIPYWALLVLTMRRRHVIAVVGTGIVTSLAGCGDDTDYEDGGENQAGGNGGGSDQKLEILEDRDGDHSWEIWEEIAVDPREVDE